MPCKKLLKNISVLFIEDEEKLLQRMIDAIGAKFALFETAGNGEEGLSKSRAMKPDIIITDITMPKMDGLTMAEKIRQETLSVPIIILSAYSEKEKLLHAIDAGVVKYFIKPFDIDELLEYLCSLTKKMDSSHKVKLLNPYYFNIKHKKLSKNNSIVRLTTREIDLISYLIEAPNRLITNAKIKEKLNEGQVVSDESVRVFIRRLREKTDKEFIKNLPKQGYMLQIS